MDDNFMQNCNQPKPETGRRWVSILMMISLLVGSVSTASFAQAANKPEEEWQVGIDVSGRRMKNRTGRTGTATPSELSAPATASNATASNMAVNNTSLGELLEQSDTSGAITAERFQVKLDETIISNSDDYRVKIKSGTRIRPNTIVEHRLWLTVQPHMLEEGDTVTWKLGRVEGLNLPEEVWEEMSYEGTHFGCACLRYEDDGMLYLTMEFYKEIEDFQKVLLVEYWYESKFIPVEKDTILEFDLPGYEQPERAVLLSKPAIEEPVTKVPATDEPAADEPTTRQPAADEPATAAPTTEEPAAGQSTAEEPAKTRQRNSRGSSAVTDKTVAELQTAAATENTDNTNEYLEQPQTQTAAALPDALTGMTNDETDRRDFGSSNSAAGADGGGTNRVAKLPNERQQDTTPKLEIVEAAAGQTRVRPGERIEYRIVVRNEGNEIMKDIRIRDYLPDYTSFISVEDGSYGVINGRQQVTWMLDQLEPGEEKKLVLALRVFQCIPENYRIENQVYWQADNKAKTNDPENPSEVKSLSDIIVG